MMSAAASIGSILLWDVEVGLAQIDKYLYSKDEYIKVVWSYTCSVSQHISKCFIIGWGSLVDWCRDLWCSK